MDRDESREQLADWMTRHGISTWPEDTTKVLLDRMEVNMEGILDQHTALLEALKKARQTLQECADDTVGTPTVEFFRSEVAACSAAIAKAEGRV